MAIALLSDAERDLRQEDSLKVSQAFQPYKTSEDVRPCSESTNHHDHRLPNKKSVVHSAATYPTLVNERFTVLLFSVVVFYLFLNTPSLAPNLSSYIVKMQLPRIDWQAQAEAKAAATLSKIPDQWRLKQDVIDDAKNRRQLAGDFIIQLIDSKTVDCISHDSKELVDLIGKKVYTSVQVAQAFCKTAAVAHQIVGSSWFLYFLEEVSFIFSS